MLEGQFSVIKYLLCLKVVSSSTITQTITKFYYLPHTLRDALIVQLYSQHEPWCTLACGMSKMFQEIVELGIHIHVHIQRKQTKWTLTFYDYKNYILPNIHTSDHPACEFLSISSCCIVDYQCGTIIRTDVKLSLKGRK